MEGGAGKGPDGRNVQQKVYACVDCTRTQRITTGPNVDSCCERRRPSLSSSTKSMTVYSKRNEWSCTKPISMQSWRITEGDERLKCRRYTLVCSSVALGTCAGGKTYIAAIIGQSSATADSITASLDQVKLQETGQDLDQFLGDTTTPERAVEKPRKTKKTKKVIPQPVYSSSDEDDNNSKIEILADQDYEDL